MARWIHISCPPAPKSLSRGVRNVHPPSSSPALAPEKLRAVGQLGAVRASEFHPNHSLAPTLVFFIFHYKVLTVLLSLPQFPVPTRPNDLRSPPRRHTLRLLNPGDQELRRPAPVPDTPYSLIITAPRQPLVYGSQALC